jgi:hypothetical protein
MMLSWDGCSRALDGLENDARLLAACRAQNVALIRKSNHNT